MPKLRVIIKPPPEPQGDAEQQTEALRDYLLQMSEELAYVLTHLEADNINDSTFERIQSMIPRPYTGLPVMDGDASSGQSEQWARGDHRHGHDSSKADVTALEAEAAAREAHEDDTDNPHEVTKAQVGLGDVANERQYSAQNPPPLPSPADIGAAEAQDLTDHVNDTANPHGVTAAQAGARPDTWMPTAADVGARADTWMPTASDVGARPDTWTPTAADVGARPDDWVPDAEDVPYDNTGSGLMATDVQAAIDELAQGGGGGTAASAVSYDNTGSGLVATNVQDAIDETLGNIPAQPSDIGAQPTITASGILKGDGQGGVSAAVAGTDYQAPLTAGTDYATPAQLEDKAAKADLTSIQATGTTNTTGAAIPAGAYFYLNGVLHRAKTQIDVNATFTVNTNCEAVPEGGLNETIQGIDISSYITPATGVNISRAYRVGRLVYICGSVPKFTAANTVVSVGTMTKCKPFASIAIGNLAQATASDFGYGNILITTTGAMEAIYSKTTSYGVYFSICYYTVDL